MHSLLLEDTKIREPARCQETGISKGDVTDSRRTGKWKEAFYSVMRGK